MATIPLAGQHSGRWAQLGSRLQHGGGRAALRSAGRLIFLGLFWHMPIVCELRS
ncbi:hypothetical protein ACRRTK_014404 [Alexandromys fortis]